MCPWRLGVEAGVFLEPRARDSIPPLRNSRASRCGRGAFMVALAGRVADVFPSSDALSEMVWLVPVLDGA